MHLPAPAGLRALALPAAGGLRLSMLPADTGLGATGMAASVTSPFATAAFPAGGEVSAARLPARGSGVDRAADEVSHESAEAGTLLSEGRGRGRQGGNDGEGCSCPVHGSAPDSMQKATPLRVVLQ